MNKVGIFFVGLIYLGVGFIAGLPVGWQSGYSEGREDFAPQIIEKTVEVPVYHYEEKVIYVVLPYETIKEAVITEYVDRDLSDWETADDLREFLAQDNTDSKVFLTADKDGIIKLNGQCEDLALQLIDNAADMGKRLFFVPLNYKEYEKWYGEELEPGRYHAICAALVGDNEFWYIEPADDRCWLALYLD